MTKQPPQIEIRLEGPAVPGRISVDALTNLAKELQTSLRRMLSMRQQAQGRFHGEIEQNCKLELTAFAQGSAVLTFEFAGPRDANTLHGDQGVRIAEEMFTALKAGEAGKDDWHADLQRSVLEGWEKMTRPLGEGVDSINLKLIDGKKKHETTITQKFRSNLRSVTSTRPQTSEATIEGVLWECDWKEHTALLDETDGNRVTLELPPGLEEQVTALRRQRVRVRGVIESDKGCILRMKVATVAPAVDGVAESDPRYGGFWENLSADELARRQGVEPVQNVADLAGDWPPEDSIDEFLELVREVRGR